MLAPMVVDIETVNAAGVADYRWWASGFRILSIAMAWRDGLDVRTWFTADPIKIDIAVKRLSEQRRQLIVHNLAFEKGVFETLYPELQFNWYADTMRMAQLHDNGGDWRDLVFNEDVLDEDASPDLGLSLEAAASRVLERDLHHHKAERDEYLRALGVRSGFGGHIHRLPLFILESYNIADTTVTLELFEKLHGILDGVWQKDWNLYQYRTELMNHAYRKGILIDTDSLWEYIQHIDQEIDQIEQEFRSKFTTEIEKWGKLYQTDPNSFNVGSNKQLRELFVGICGITGKHMTEKGALQVKSGLLPLDRALNEYPSFKSKHLKDWGAGGMLLAKRRKRMLVLSQTLSTHWMATQGEGRIHPEIRVAGTRTNRVSGGRDE